MKLTMKKTLTFLLIFIVILLFFMPKSSLARENSFINFIIKGKHLKMDHKAQIIDSRTYIYIRDFAKALDMKVEWLGPERTVKLSDSKTTILIPIEDNKITINEKKVALEEKNFVKKGRTYIPLRAFAEALSYEVKWDSKNQIVIVGKYRGEENLKDTFIYLNEEYNYTMNFPNSWKEEAVLETKDGILKVYDKISYDKFKEKGFKNFGPVFEIRVGESPVFISVPYEDVLLYYKDGLYIETYFGRDFQYFPDTVDSYKKIYKEAEESLGSFKALEEKEKNTDSKEEEETLENKESEEDKKDINKEDINKK